MRKEDGVGDAQVPPPNGHEPLGDLVPVIRRVVAARIRDPTQVEDLVQETLSRVMAARSRVERDTLAPYAVATARNLIASTAQREQRARQLAHLLIEPDDPQPRPEDEALREADAADRELELLDAAGIRARNPALRGELLGALWCGRDATVESRVALPPLAVADRGRRRGQLPLLPRLRRTRAGPAAGAATAGRRRRRTPDAAAGRATPRRRDHHR